MLTANPSDITAILSVWITLVEQATNRKNYDQLQKKCLQTTTNVDKDVQGKGTLIHCWWECKLVQPLWKTVWREALQNTKNRTAI
jgi:hypothetical protein